MVAGVHTGREAGATPGSPAGPSACTYALWSWCPSFIALFWWQVQRVREGNSLSWAYVFEWPFFTGYAVYLWWRLVHEQPALTETSGDGSAGVNGTTAAAADGKAEADEEVATCNRYLAELAQYDAERERR